MTQRSTHTPPVPPKARDLTVNKVLAGAGAASTSAVLGSLFGATGTVVGAALGSVASTVATTVYQRSLDRTRDTVVARIRRQGSGGEATVPMPRLPVDGDTVRLRAEPAAPRSRLGMIVGFAVLVFALALGAVTGLELARGSTLTAQEPGTSVGRVLDGGVVSPATRGPVPTTDPAPAPTRTPTPTPSPSPTTGPTTGPAPTTAPIPGTSPSSPGTSTPPPPLIPGVP